MQINRIGQDVLKTEIGKKTKQKLEKVFHTILQEEYAEFIELVLAVQRNDDLDEYFWRYN